MSVSHELILDYSPQCAVSGSSPLYFGGEISINTTADIIEMVQKNYCCDNCQKITKMKKKKTEIQSIREPDCLINKQHERHYCHLLRLWEPLCETYLHAWASVFRKHDSFLLCHSAIRGHHLFTAPLCAALPQMLITAFHSHRYVSVQRAAKRGCCSLGSRCHVL